MKNITYICCMKTETRIINKNSGVIHKIDEVYYYDDNNYVIFTEDKNCFPSENVRFLTTNEKYSELSKHFVSTLNKNGELDKLKNYIKKLNKQRNERIINPITTTNTSWLRKVLSYVS